MAMGAQLVGEKRMRHVVIYPGEDGYWIAECPSLPGCISQGRTKEEAVANIPEERFETLALAV